MKISEEKQQPQYLTTKGELAMERYIEFDQFRENLLLLRAYNRFTLEDIGKVLDIRPSRVNDYENGRCHPKWDEIRKIASYFSITIDQLMYHKATVTFEGKEPISKRISVGLSTRVENLRNSNIINHQDAEAILKNI